MSIFAAIIIFVVLYMSSDSLNKDSGRDIFAEGIGEVIAENDRRNRRLAERLDYDPLTGKGCDGPRVEVADDGRVCRLPVSMVRDSLYALTGANPLDRERLRCRHDFEYWAARCVRIHDKRTGAMIPFVLNPPQRRVLSALELQRRAGRPIRVILLKARQWGGSTLIQVYMAWIQMCLRQNWNSFVCGHSKDVAASIFKMYDDLVAYYPDDMWGDDGPSRFVPVARSTNIRQLTGRGCCVTVGTSESQNSVRGQNIAMAHLSEVAFWRKTTGHDPRQVIRAITGAVNAQDMTLIVLESTADGPGNYFHDEWVRAVAGMSDKTPVFVAWYEIPLYRTSLPDDADALRETIESFDEYERGLFNRFDITLESLLWYHNKRVESPSHTLFMAEYPTTAREAFQATDSTVFDPESVERLREGCRRPARRGEVISEVTSHPAAPESLSRLKFVRSATGQLYVWDYPRRRGSYIVSVDIGGRTAKADWSVILVMDRCGPDSGKPEVVAQMRVHIDHDLLGWTAARIATWYNNALLVFESNTLESASLSNDFTPYILDIIRDNYSNLYCRRGGLPGFHTNRLTKPVIISHLIAMVRDGRYVERSAPALDEFSNYIAGRNGTYGAREGYHDDMVMARAIALHVIDNPTEPSGAEIDAAATFLRIPNPQY